MINIKSGNLYFDDNKKLTPDYKILNFCRDYYNKFKYNPTICLVNPKTYEEVIGDLGFFPTGNYKLVHGIRVESDIMVQENHFYFGEQE